MSSVRAFSASAPSLSAPAVLAIAAVVGLFIG